MANTIKSLQAEIDGLAAEIQPLNQDLQNCRDKLKSAKAQQWIEANGVTRDQVELSGSGRPSTTPYFHDVFAFGKWLTANSEKRFCEWNTQIFFTAEVVEQRRTRDATATVSDLPTETSTP